ncbi:MAG: hypothetical protein QOF61_61, partial [Acidobacteriota bacterium]|nr:hypothetical protein [Acidobacteriota bacterium]
MRRLAFTLTALLIFAAHAAAQKEPRSLEDFYNRGLQRQAQGDLDGALADYDQALAKKPVPAVLSQIYLNRANVLMSKGDYNAATS